MSLSTIPAALATLAHAHIDWSLDAGAVWLAGGALFAAFGACLFVAAVKAATPTPRYAWGNWKSDRAYK
jgi:hypothetical protein